MITKRTSYKNNQNLVYIIIDVNNGSNFFSWKNLKNFKIVAIENSVVVFKLFKLSGFQKERYQNAI